MEITMTIILVIGIISSIFGVLMIFAPTIVLKAERSANRIYMTDPTLMNNRIPLGVIMLIASAFLMYSYSTGPYQQIVFLYLSIVAGIFGALLLMKPDLILMVERKANKLYMTDAFFLEHRIVFGIVLIAASLFMLRTYYIFG